MLVQLWAESYAGLAQPLHDESFGALVCNQNRTTFMYVDNRFEAIASKYAENFLDEGFAKRFFASTKKARDNFAEVYSSFCQQNLKALPDSKLADLAKEYRNALYGVDLLFHYSQAEFTDTLKRILEQELARVLPQDKRATALSDLLMPARLDYIKREEIGLLDIALAGLNDAALLQHTLDYAAFFYNSYDSKNNLEFTRQRARAMEEKGKEWMEKRRAAIEEGVRHEQEWQQEQLKRLKDAKARHAALFLSQLAFDRLELKNWWAGAEYRFVGLFREIARRRAVPFNEVMDVYLFDDIYALAENGTELARKEVDARREFYGFQVNDGAITFSSGDRAVKAAKIIVPAHFDNKPIDEVKGSPANPGIATGEVYLVKVVGVDRLADDLKNFKQGQILVTTMTQPSMVLLAQKAAAIVTDEGGVTSHAAVLAREFGVPCIVGCHVATRAFKTGDRIKVDANKGIVRRA